MKIISIGLNPELSYCDSCGDEDIKFYIVELNLIRDFNIEISLCPNCYDYLKTAIFIRGKK